LLPVFALLIMFLCAGPLAADEVDLWSGPYVGVFAGYSDANDAWDQGGAANDPTISPEGIGVGGFAGYGFASKGLVLAVEGDVSFPDFGDNEMCGTGLDCSFDVKIQSSLLGRAGVAFGAVQIYGAGGVTLGVIQAESGGPGGSSESETLAGWTLGGGVEFARGRDLRFGIEYRHSDYGSRGITGTTGDDEIALETDEVRLRLSVPLN
jgi:outer membrane immunogenic protein